MWEEKSLQSGRKTKGKLEKDYRNVFKKIAHVKKATSEAKEIYKQLQQSESPEIKVTHEGREHGTRGGRKRTASNHK